MRRIREIGPIGTLGQNAGAIAKCREIGFDDYAVGPDLDMPMREATATLAAIRG
jgi:hypothetical protein